MSNPSPDSTVTKGLTPTPHSAQLDLVFPQPDFEKRLQQVMARAPRICVMGEFNAGKSTVINLLAGIPVVPTSITPNTRMPIRLFYSLKPELSMELADQTRIAVPATSDNLIGRKDAVMLHVGLPVGSLKGYDLIDTPGLQSGEDAICQRVFSTCRHAHLAIWCTTATQAWKATEAAAWKRIPVRMKANSILAVTFKDMVGSSRDQGRLWDRIRAQAAPHFSEVVMVSARDGSAARGLTDASQREKLWHLSGAAELASAVDTAVRAVKAKREHAVQTRLTTARSVDAVPS